ncbi:transcriptional regulator, partial [Escherichia coli]|nr:transcriptional regulator [Escherichia coli]EHR8612191.1 transcriptional regulator [Escherichia coli]EIK7906732.1 transcriptional regulator [Escherichia coli]
KISLTSDGLSFIQNVNIAQSLHLKEIWSPLTHAECELFEDINKKLLTHIADVCP